MKKTRLVILLVTVSIIYIMSSCSKEENQSRVNSDDIDVKIANDGMFVDKYLVCGTEVPDVTLVMYFATNNTNISLSVSDIQGENVEGITVENEIVYEDFAKDYDYRGYTAGSQVMKLKFPNAKVDTETIINSMEIVVNEDLSKKVVVEFSEPLKFSFIDDETLDNGTLHIGAFASAKSEFEYVDSNFVATEDLIVEDMHYKGCLNMINTEIIVNDVSIRKNNLLPLNLHKDDVMNVINDTELIKQVNHPVTVFTQFEIDYKKSVGEDALFAFSIVFSDMVDTDDIDEYIDACLD